MGRVLQLKDGTWGVFSAPSAVMRAGLGVSDPIIQLVGESLIVPGGFQMPATAALGGGKLVALYFRSCCSPPHGTQFLVSAVHTGALLVDSLHHSSLHSSSRCELLVSR